MTKKKVTRGGKKLNTDYPDCEYLTLKNNAIWIKVKNRKMNDFRTPFDGKNTMMEINLLKS